MKQLLLIPIQTLFHCLGRMWRSVWLTVFTVSSVGVVLSLPIGLYTLSESVSTVTSTLKDTQEITVFMSKDASENVIASLQSELVLFPEIKSIQTISEDEALEEFKEITGLHSIIEFVPDNPLPTTIVVRLQDDHSSIESFEMLANRIRKYDYVDIVEFDLLWINRLRSSLDLSYTIFKIVSSLLLLAAILIICNATRISVSSRSEEILIIRQVGGTRGFIHRPFVYTAVLQSLLAAGLGFGIVEGLRRLINQPLQKVAALYSSDFSITGLTLETISLITVSIAILTWVAATVTVSMYLKRDGS